MEKKIRDFELDYYLSWTYGIEISRLREDLDALEKLGATSIDIESYSDYGSPSVSIKAIARRMETDKECLERTNKEADARKKAEEFELRQFNALKLKYEQK